MTKIATKPLSERLYLNSVETQQLVTRAKTHPRDLAIVLLLMDTGLFLSELTALALEDIEFHKEEVRLKGNRERILPLKEETVEAIREWVYVRPTIDGLPLFTTLKGVPKGLADRSAEAVLKKLSEEAGLGMMVNARLLRNTYAVRLFQSGMEKPEIKKRLGISDEGSLNKYRNMAIPQSRNKKKAKKKGKLKRALMGFGLGVAVYTLFKGVSSAEE